MQQKFILALVVIAVIGIGLFGYVQASTYLEHRRQAELALSDAKKSVAQTTAAAESLLELEIDPKSITYAEMFERSSERTKAIETAVIDVQASNIDDESKKFIVEYMQSVQQLIRLQESMNRKVVNLKSEVEIWSQSIEDYKNSPYNEYSNKYELQRLKKQQADVNKADIEMKESRVDFYKGIDDLQSVIKRVEPKMSGFSIIDQSLLTKVAATKSVSS